MKSIGGIGKGESYAATFTFQNLRSGIKNSVFKVTIRKKEAACTCDTGSDDETVRYCCSQVLIRNYCRPENQKSCRRLEANDSREESFALVPDMY